MFPVKHSHYLWMACHQNKKFLFIGNTILTALIYEPLLGNIPRMKANHWFLKNFSKKQKVQEFKA